MVHKVIGVARRAQPLLRVTAQKLHDDVLDLIRHRNAMSHRVREDDLALSNQLAQLVVILMHKWRPSSNHLVNQHSQGPPIDGEGVTGLVENLRRQVLGSAAEALGLLLLLKELSETEVG